MDQIIIHMNEEGTYECEFLGPHSEEVLALFGTRVIPTPYSEPTNAQTVRQHIYRRNNGIPVDLCGCVNRREQRGI
jgi:hypothetical protein